MSTLRATHLCAHQRSHSVSPLRSWGLEINSKDYPIDSFCFSQPAGRNLCLRCPRPIAAKLVDRSFCGLLPQIAPFLMRGLTRPARRDRCPRYVRPASARIKGATPCLHFVRGALGTKQSGAPHSAPDCLVPEVTPLTAMTA